MAGRNLFVPDIFDIRWIQAKAHLWTCQSCQGYVSILNSSLTSMTLVRLLVNVPKLSQRETTRTENQGVTIEWSTICCLPKWIYVGENVPKLWAEICSWGPPFTIMLWFDYRMFCILFGDYSIAWNSGRGIFRLKIHDLVNL